MSSDPGIREPGSIVLASCYELGHQPLSLAAPAARLRHSGFSPRLLDLSQQAFDAELFSRARLVAISVPMHTALVLGIRLARRVRALNPACHISMFGHYAGLNRASLIGPIADSTIAGAAEAALVELAEGLGSQQALKVSGLSTIDSSSEPRIAKPDSFLPDRTGLPGLDSYVSLQTEFGSRRVGYVEATVGCKHHCLHCPIPPLYKGRFLAVPKVRVLGDIRQLVAMGAEHITFGDPDFLNGPGHARAIVRELHAEFPELSYDFTAKIEHLLRHRELLPEFRRTGCRFIVTAVESLSDRVLFNLDKGHTRADILEAFELADRSGIPLRPSLLPFTPWSTLGDYLDLLEWIGDSNLTGNVDPIQLAIRLLVPAGSALLGKAQFEPYRRDWDRKRLCWNWEHPDPRMDNLQREVSELIESDSAPRSSPQDMFRAVRERAYQRADAPPPEWIPGTPPTAVPRLSEPWFC